MSKINYNILLGCVIILIGIVLHGYITKPIDSKLLNEYEVCYKNSINQVLNLNQASEYLNMSESQVKGIIVAESSRLNKYGSFSGTMLPYIKIDNEYYFYQETLNEWLSNVTYEKREYDTQKYEIKN